MVGAGIAAGHPATADAGAEILAEGGSAADAAVAACLASCVAETIMTGLLGGGHRDAGLDGSGRPVAQLAILPGLTHYNISSFLALATAVNPFLDAAVPGAK